MSGKLNRHFMASAQRGQGDGPNTEQRNLGNGHSQTNSPLRLFGQAKKKINDIFKDIGKYITEAETFLEDASSVSDLVSDEYRSLCSGFKQKVLGISEVLSRDHMKVAFFGRTSNGKSSVINAMLGEKILPSGIGHTTNCFLQVEGTDGPEPYLQTDDVDQSEKEMNIGSIKQMAHALSSFKLSSNSLIHIFWPKAKFRLLREDVVLVDSPGIDVTQDLDVCIDKYCLDADVFVLVGNAESTLMQTEKNFFHKVSSRLSKPNIFILQNRWDMSATEEDANEVRAQHLERNIQFLADELRVCDTVEAENRIFFISAREAVISRSDERHTPTTPVAGLAEGYQARMCEFHNFETKFEECISKSAVTTKFEQHTERAKLINNDVKTIMDEVHIASLKMKSDQVTLRNEKAEELDYMNKQLILLTHEIKDKIKGMVEDVERKVSTALNQEIRRLAIVVDEFDRPFHPDQNVLNVYKKELHAHVELGLGRNLQSRCSSVLTRGVEQTQNDMTERLSELLSDEGKQLIHSQFPKHDFEIAYRLDCKNLCGDFQEDIAFRFSLGPTALLQRFLGGRGVRPMSLPLLNQGIGTSPQTPLPPIGKADSSQDSDVMLHMLTAFASLTSRTTVGAVIVTGLVTKAAGWRVIAVVGALYGVVYMFERLTWTNKAKERAFKHQYVDYAGSKLKLIVDLTGANCSHQVQQELSTSFARLSHQVDIARSRVEEEIKKLDTEISKLTDVSGKAKVLKNKADFLDSELNSFISKYLRLES